MVRLSTVALIGSSLVGSIVLSGCTSTPDVLETVEVDGRRPQVTGTYPSLSAPLEAAGEQMSDSEAAAIGARLEALAGARRAGAISQAEYQRRLAALRKLARTHDTEATGEIEN